MDSLTSLTSFVRTAETLSFVQAARLLGISASAVGKMSPGWSINWGSGCSTAAPETSA